MSEELSKKAKEFFRKAGRRGGKIGGAKGGKNSRKNLTDEQKTALAKKAAAARWKRD